MNSKENTRHYLPALISALALFLFAAIFMVAPAAAQKTQQLPPPPPVPIYRPKPTPTPAPEELDVVRITSNLIAVPVSVTDPNGQPVLGLSANEFRIEEDGRSQQIAQLGDPEQVPLDIALLIDVSGSVEASFGFEQRAAADFLRQVMKHGDRATVFAIADKPLFVQGFANAEVAARQLLTVRPTKGSTAFFDSVLAAEKYLDKNSSQGRRRVIVAISDGEETARILSQHESDKAKGGSKLSLVENQVRFIERANAEVVKEVQRGEVTFYSINPSGRTMHLNVRIARSQKGLEKLAAATGGAAFVPRTETDLPAIFQRIASEIRTQYLLQYYSDNKSGGSAFRRIKVTAPTRPELRLRTREGYFPKGQ